MTENNTLEKQSVKNLQFKINPEMDGRNRGC